MVLENTLWVLVSFAGKGDPRSVLKGSQINATFDTAQGRVAGSAGCNRYFANFEVKGNALTVGTPATTLMMCQPAVMEQEQLYLAALESAGSYEVTGGQLRLSCSGGTVLTFAGRPKSNMGDPSQAETNHARRAAWLCVTRSPPAPGAG